jgi:hypothetical protein
MFLAVNGIVVICFPAQFYTTIVEIVGNFCHNLECLQVPVSSVSSSAADLETYVMRQSPRISHQLVTLNSRTFDVADNTLTPAMVTCNPVCCAVASRSFCAQGFAPSATPVNILFEENVYCGDSSSTFFTVLWINKCDINALPAVVRVSPPAGCWKNPPRPKQRHRRRCTGPRPLLRPCPALPPPLTARSMLTCCLKSVGARTSALVCCTCNAAPSPCLPLLKLPQVSRRCAAPDRRAAAAG